MPFQPYDWGVVIAGSWNSALLNPNGIARHLFQLQANTPVEVLINLDRREPPRVKYNDIVVVASDQNLVVQPIHQNYEALDTAKQIAAHAIEELPKTPLIATGINVRYRTDEPLGALQQILTHPSDNTLSDQGINIVARSHKRTIDWNEGVVNISIELLQNGNYQVLFNFEKQSSTPALLKGWLESPVQTIKEFVDSLVETYLGIETEE